MTKILIRHLWIAAAAFAMAACAAQSGGGGALQAGMTADQAVAAMGQPDLKDQVPDPNRSGATMLRYSWLSEGKAAVFNSDSRVASIQDIGRNPSTLTETVQQQQEQVTPSTFDPIQTPLDYFFYPFRAALVYIGAGLNCVGGNGCRNPQLPRANLSG